MRTPIIPTHRISITLGAVETSVVVSIRARRTFREVRTSRSWRRDTAQDVRIGQTGSYFGAQIACAYGVLISVRSEVELRSPSGHPQGNEGELLDGPFRRKIRPRNGLVPVRGLALGGGE